MKKMKRILALALSLVMIMGMSMTVFAGETTPGDGSGETVEETTPGTGDTGTGTGTATSTDPEFDKDSTADAKGMYTLTIDNPAVNHKYEIYQIFTGDVAAKKDEDGNKTDTAVLSNIKYGSSYGATGNSLSETDVQLLNNNMTDAIALAKYYNSENRLKGAYTTLTADDATAQVPAGYYLVKDVWAGSEPAEGTEQFSAYMVSIVGATTFTLKTITNPTLEKTSEDLKIVSDKKVGDEVPFQLKATLPEGLDFSNFETYTITFNDTLSVGLDADVNSILVKVNGRPVPATGDTISLEDVLENGQVVGHALTYKIDNVIGWKGITVENAPGTVITIDYTATINKMAITSTGEKNEATLDYTNNPDGGQGSTPGDDVKIFFAQLIINKKDGANNNSPLTGAGFTLFKYEGEEKSFDPSDYTPDKVDVANAYRTAVVSNDEDGTVGSTFTFGGLEAGTYVLVETTTPNGYNTMESKLIKITFTANEATGEVTKIDAETLSASTNDDWACELQSNNTENTVYGTITTDIVNNAGLELPSTGGIGTTIFYVIGGVMVLGACVLLITKRRMKSRG